ncbi:MAG TPA: adenylate/guanylate cyclase domain-containing protein [Acidimicrobiales bacterium]|nr:adenylate/guanylate cyclase domain-containing protein [Acidimicrobiales bacterium]
MAGPKLSGPEVSGPQPGPPGADTEMSTGELRHALDQFASSVLPHTRHLTDVEVAAESGVDVELARRLRRAMGLPDVPLGEGAYLPADVEALKRVRHLVETGKLADSDLLHMARTLGLAAARMAEAVVGFWSDRMATGTGTDMLDPERVDELEQIVGYLFRRHLLDSVARHAATVTDAGEGPPVAVGFADLVGFTSLSEQLTDRETAELIERFEFLATDLVVGGGGRVIKMIGDEVMFTADVEQVGDIALSLAETFSSPDLPAVRVGAACGTVVSQGGDIFGPVVNMAQRATMAARAGSVLVSPALADSLRGDPRYSVYAIRPHRLKGIGIVRLAVLRRATRNSG